MAVVTPFPVGTASTDAELAADLGNVYWVGAKAYRLVKAAAALSGARYMTLVTAVSSGVRTWACTTSTTANDPLVAGVVPATQVDSLGAAGLLSGDYFLIQVSGSCKGISAAAIAASVPVGTSTTAGKIDDASITAGVGAMGVSDESASAGDENTDICLRGLL